MEQATDPKAPPRRRIREFEVVIARAIVETADTTTLVLSAGDLPVEYLAGQFLTIDPHQFAPLAGFVGFLEELKGKREPPRAYSLASAPHEAALAITIKEERYVAGQTRYPPLLSPLLVYGLRAGARIVVSGFTGPYTLPDDAEARAERVVHVCAGSGSVPNLSILKHALRRHPRLRHTFVYSNKTWDDVIFRRELGALEAAHPDRLRVIHTLTREPDPWRHDGRVRRGRLSAALLREAIPDPSAALIYACGPAIGPYERQAARERGVEPAPRFIEHVLDLLAEVGVPDARIKRESWG
jgi:ferredoxin-NADP reductase